MNKSEAQIRFWGDKFFPHLMPHIRYALVRELLRLSCLLLCALAFTSCSMVSGTRKPDGSLVVTSWRCLWKSEAIDFHTSDETNFNATLTIGKSRSDEESIALAVQAAVAAAMKGVVP